MRKYLIAISVVIALAIYVAIQNQNSTENRAQPAAQSSNSAVSEETDQQHPQSYTNKSSWNPPSWYRLFAWPDGVTAWAIILTLIAIADQTKQTAKAARAFAKTGPGIYNEIT